MSEHGWYELFSRGARDWLRHNEKVREAVHQHLPELVANADVLEGGTRTVRVPVRMLEHHHFRLLRPGEQEGVGQGEGVRPGDRLAGPASPAGPGRGPGGREQGGMEFVLELQVDDIVDWLWDEMRLPNLQPRAGGAAEETDWIREGWDRKGARSRLDRRRSFRESLKRRASQAGAAQPAADGKPPPAFTDDDLRFRQLNRRARPATQAVVFLLMDVSGSMADADRKLAKSFFFWAVQGLRRQYRHIETVFVAHTTEAWEFDEARFFEVRGDGGTIASSGFQKVQEIVAERYSPSRYNIYLFYASDGDNALSDRADAAARLAQLRESASYCGFLEVSAAVQRHLTTETARLFRNSPGSGGAGTLGSFPVSRTEDIWNAVRHFFSHQQRGQESAS
ncbi:MAG: DUF444 family protein [Steroidobacteraceae bacterium]|nr:DUF444 family protein [Steroidobacteraceae bacterium]